MERRGRIQAWRVHERADAAFAVFAGNVEARAKFLRVRDVICASLREGRKPVIEGLGGSADRREHVASKFFARPMDRVLPHAARPQIALGHDCRLVTGYDRRGRAPGCPGDNVITWVQQVPIVAAHAVCGRVAPKRFTPGEDRA